MSYGKTFLFKKTPGIFFSFKKEDFSKGKRAYGHPIHGCLVHWFSQIQINIELLHTKEKKLNGIKKTPTQKIRISFLNKIIWYKENVTLLMKIISTTKLCIDNSL